VQAALEERYLHIGVIWGILAVILLNEKSNILDLKIEKTLN
jgi:hypothetical protein